MTALRHTYRLDRPLPVQFAHYVAGIATGDMGTSLFTQRHVPATLELAMYTTIIAAAGGIPLTWLPRCGAIHGWTTRCG